MSQAARIPGWAWLLAALLIAAANVGTVVPQDWAALDEGTLSLSARYAAAGYLPHRDFAYPYTGGLAFVGALTMRAFGDTMIAARWVLFGAFLLWLCGIWSLARRNCEPLVAAVVVVAAAWWSLLIYPAALPTWYLLFLATASVLALLKWDETDRLAWLVVAGLACGAAIAIKQTGLYTLAGAGLGVLAIRQEKASTAGTRIVSIPVIVALCLGFLVPSLLMARRGFLSGDTLIVALPMIAVIEALLARQHRTGCGSPRELYKAWGVLVAGAAILPIILLLLFAAKGGAGALVDGLIEGSIRTAGFIDRPLPGPGVILLHGVPIAVVVAALAALRPSRLQIAISIVVAIGVFAAAWKSDPGYRAVWYFGTLIIPTVLGAIALMETDERLRRPLPVLVPVLGAAVALQGLNQYPLGAPNYFGYVAPLGFLLVAGLASHLKFANRLAFVAALLVAYGGWFHRIGDISTLSYGPVWRETTHALPGPHAGLRVPASDSAEYARLMELVRAHGGADSITAGPELASLYVLGGTKRLVRQPYLLVPEAEADSVAMAASLDVRATRAVAIQRKPLFLPTVRPDADAWLARQFPNVERVGTIDFRWR